MEHLTSTQIIATGALDESAIYGFTLQDVSHEFFHVWNGKRLRPQELGPWDFTRPVATRSLWIAEGFTNYYGHLMLRRAGIWDDARFLLSKSRGLMRIEPAQGSRLTSAEESSLSAPFNDRAPQPVQSTNLKNTSISYYSKGELIALVLDLLIRGRTKGKASLDDVMRDMYEEFYLKSRNSSYYLRGRGYQPEDLERIVSRRSGFDFSDFFKRYTRSPEVLPYDEAFAYVGLHLVRKQATEPYDAGLLIGFENGKAVIQSVVNNSPAENAGLQKNDEIVALDGKPIAEDSWRKTLASFKPGDSVPITVKRGRQKIGANIVLGHPERFEYTIEEKNGATEEQKALRAAWLNGK